MLRSINYRYMKENDTFWKKYKKDFKNAFFFSGVKSNADQMEEAAKQLNHENFKDSKLKREDF